MIRSARLAEQLQMLGIDLPPFGSIEIGDSETLYFTVHNHDPLDLWIVLRGAVDKIGFWPLLTWDEEILGIRLEWLPETVQGLLQRMATLDARSWLDDHVARRMRWDKDFEQQVAAGVPALEPKPRHKFELPYRWGHPQQRAPFLVLVPTVHSWQVPLYLCFGSFNHCPSPEENACVLRYWHELYRAELVSMTRDALELLVREPPRQASDAFMLACDQYGYCHDMHQTYWPVDDLASRLLGGTSWFFWWD